MEIKIRNKNINESFPTNFTSIVRDFSATAQPMPACMPDIINEAEVLRRQQMQIEQEIKQLEQQVQVPYVFFREIPNKPPPPYIPPANGSPLALIFPTNERVEELVTQIVAELYESYSSNTIFAFRSDESITNVYEKLIIDLCHEYFDELKPPKKDVSFKTVKVDKRPLAFYNPPDDLTCMTAFVQKKIASALNPDNFRCHQAPFMFNCSKRKRDVVDEILVQEMTEDEIKWTNFDNEEIDVKNDVTNEILKILMDEALADMEKAFEEKCKRMVPY